MSQDQSLQTSTQPALLECFSSSAKDKWTELHELPAAGKTLSKRFKDISKYTFTPGLTAKGQTPPGVCPVYSSTLSAGIIFAFWENASLYFLLSTFASPAITMSTGSLSIKNDKVFAICFSRHPSASAASITVALDFSSCITFSSRPAALK